MKFHFFYLALLVTSLITYQMFGPQSVLADENNVSVTTNQNTVVIANSPTPQTTLVMTDDRETVKPGENITYRIVVRNTHEDDINEVKVVAHIPEYIVPQATAPEAQADPATRTITWTDQTLSAKSEITFAIKAQVAASTPGSFTLRARSEINGPGLRASASDTTVVEGSAAATAAGTTTQSSTQKVEVVDQAARSVATTSTTTTVSPTAPTGFSGFSSLALFSAILAGIAGICSLGIKKLVY